MAPTFSMRIRPISIEDQAEWLRMRKALWPGSAATHERDVARFFDRPDDRCMVFVAERRSGGLAGFLELGWRNFAEGCTTSPVAYIEAWYVDPDLRRCGVGRSLVQSAEEWAPRAGYRQIASDTDLDNATSIAAHGALGYTGAGRIVCFRRDLENGV